MIGVRKANKLIGKSKYEEKVKFKNGDVDDIINVILEADKVSAPFTRKLAKAFKGSEEKILFDIWAFTRKHIRYIQDSPGHEKIKSPGATWRDRAGDCKSMSVFNASILKNLKIPYKYKIVFYDPNQPSQGHIYPIALLDGREVVLDSVNSQFNKEERYWRDYVVYPSLQEGRIAGPPSQGIVSNIVISLLLYFILK